MTDLVTVSLVDAEDPDYDFYVYTSTAVPRKGDVLTHSSQVLPQAPVTYEVIRVLWDVEERPRGTTGLTAVVILRNTRGEDTGDA